MPRSGAQLRRTEIKRTSKLERGGPLRQRSAKRAKIMATERRPLVSELRQLGVRCEVCPRIDAAGFEVHCGGEIQGIHERRKRGSAGSLLVAENLIPSCNWGNVWIEDHPLLAREIGTELVVRPGDDEWDRLGVREEKTEVEVLTCGRCGSHYVTLHTGCG